jgi:uncharacterized protein YkwD
MKQFIMPNYVLGDRLQLFAHSSKSVKELIIVALHKFWATVVINRYALSVLFAIAIFLSPPLTLLAKSPVANAAQTPTNSAVITRSDAEIYYLNAINGLRNSRGLAPLIIDSRLSVSATQKGNDMVLQNYWGHYAPNGMSFSDYIWGTSPKADKVGENLARCFETRESAFEALVASPTHYAIMVGGYSNFGVAEVQDESSGCTYTTMHFADYGN